MSDPINMQPTSSSSSTHRSGLSSLQREQLEAMTVCDPDDLLAPSRSLALTFAVVVSILCHVGILGATSIGLLSEWQQHGVKMPAAIRAEKEQQREAAKMKERDAKIEAERKSTTDATDTKPDASGDNPTTATAEKSPPNDDKRQKPADSFNIEDIDLDL